MARYISGVKLCDYANCADKEPICYDESFGFCYYTQGGTYYVDKRTGILLRPFTELRDVISMHVYDGNYSLGDDFTMSLLHEVFGRSFYHHGSIVAGDVEIKWDEQYVKFRSKPLVCDSKDLIVYSADIDADKRHNMHMMARANGLVTLAFEESGVYAVVMPMLFVAHLFGQSVEKLRDDLQKNFCKNVISFSPDHIK